MADYALIGTVAVLHSSTGRIIPTDEGNKDYVEYQTWALSFSADAQTQSLAEYKDQVSAQVNREAEAQLMKWRPEDASGSLSTLDFDTLRSEAAAATIEGTPWAAGYPFLEEQIGIHGADTGAVATYWTGVWDAYVLQAKLIEAAREQMLEDIIAAANFAATVAIKNAIEWPNVPEPGANAVTLVAPDPVLDGPAATIAISPDAGAITLGIPATTTNIPIDGGPSAITTAAPDTQILIA
jgi:uncharacterized membrane protein